MSAASLALVHETMTAIFNPKHKTNNDKDLLPFGGKKMIFLGDPAQLRPVAGAAIYDKGDTSQASRKASSRSTQRTVKGQTLYRKYLQPNCVFLNRSKRNSGLLDYICDRIREGKQDEDDLSMLTVQQRRFPQVVTDYGIHYENDMCSMYNWRQLWADCSSSIPPRRMFICKATYETMSGNQPIIDALASLPPRSYNYAPDTLCVAEGCDVRLVYNVNVAAGLVNSASGTVVKVIFNNAETRSLLDGKHVPPYCIVVDFPGFHGFVEKTGNAESRIFPFPNHKQWVPVYRQKFSVSIKDLPAWVRKKQMPKDCYRLQFPLDLSRNITCHRAQGQTLANSLVSVNLGLDSPDKRLPQEIGSIVYVACTRVKKLEHLFVSPIFPSVWEKIGKSDMDEHRRTVEQKLREAATDFAAIHGKYKEMKAELSWTPDYSGNDQEWRELSVQSEPPKSTKAIHSRQQLCDADFEVRFRDKKFQMFVTPVLSERHIGLDQGSKNFGMAVVEVSHGNPPNVVFAENYTNLALRDRCQASDVVMALSEKTDLIPWMQPSHPVSKVDRVVVHLEQIDPKNRKWKQFSMDLGILLQKKASDVNKCIVKMSQPHIHRATGPAFRLGERIITELQLTPIQSTAATSLAEHNPAVNLSVRPRTQNASDVEPNSSDDDVVVPSVPTKATIYRQKKKMSADIFRYIVQADTNQLADLTISMNDEVRVYWREKLNENAVKLDDVGDALLHAIDELLCGSNNFQQLLPATPSLHNNRTVALAMFPSVTFWIVLHCTWNMFVLENFGWYDSKLRTCHFKDESTVESIRSNIIPELRIAVAGFRGSDEHAEVDHIKVIVKQLTGHTDYNLTNIEAGALTEATTNAMKRICNDTVGPNSTLCDRRDKVLGNMYVRTNKLTGAKYQVITSTGKHTNAVLSCLEWMKEHVPDYVKERRATMNEKEKIKFFNALQRVAHSEDNRLEMLHLSNTVKSRFRYYDVEKMETVTTKRNITDLILIAMAKNQQYVKAVAAHYRKPRTESKTTKSKKHSDES